MSGISELHSAFKTAWEDAGLTGKFQAYWLAADRSNYTALNDGEAAPGTPFPYCVYEIVGGTVTDRMSGRTADGENYMVQDVPITIKIFAGQHSTTSAKAVSVALAEEVIKVFGGHPDPTESPVGLTLTNYGHLLTQYQTDFGARLGDREYLWTIEYIVRLDMPVSV